MAEAKELSIGGFWAKEGQNGTYYTGNVTVNGEEVKIVCFPNKYATAENRQPTYRILKSKPREETETETF